MKITVLIPCHNEELTVRRCIESVLNQSRKADEVIVVNDGSRDTTLKILKQFKKKIKVISISKKTGNKSIAQERGFKHATGDIIITTDADSILDCHFIKNISKEFKDKKVAAVAGYVKSIENNWLTSCRQIDYLISQEIHKRAQSLVNALYVIPGCAGAYRREVFNTYISFDHDTVTEDLDFTYKYHRNDLKVGYCKDAVVYTEDPSTLKDYIIQLQRWHAGNWQNLIKHISVINKPGNALELTLTYLEGLTFPLLLVIAFILNFNVFMYFSVTYLVIISLFALYGAKRDNRWDIVAHVVTYYFISFINYGIFIEQFLREVVFQKRNLAWFKPERKAAYS